MRLVQLVLEMGPSGTRSVGDKLCLSSSDAIQSEAPHGSIAYALRSLCLEELKGLSHHPRSEQNGFSLLLGSDTLAALG